MLQPLRAKEVHAARGSSDGLKANGLVVTSLEAFLEHNATATASEAGQITPKRFADCRVW